MVNSCSPTRACCLGFNLSSRVVKDEVEDEVKDEVEGKVMDKIDDEVED